MIKKLVFFWYIDIRYVTSKVYKLHLSLLSRYACVFDNALFIMSLKTDDYEHRKMANDIISQLIKSGYSDIRVIFELNTEIREAKAFYEHIHSSVTNGDQELIFFGHNKGTTNDLNESLLAWICSMYYFSLERSNDAFYKLLSCRRVAYGFPAVMSSDGIKNIFLPINRFYYMGGIYWINVPLANTAIKIGLSECHSQLSDRYYVEDYVGNMFDSSKCGTYCDVAMFDHTFNATYGFHEAINTQFFDYIKDDNLKTCFWDYVDNVKREIGL